MSRFFILDFVVFNAENNLPNNGEIDNDADVYVLDTRDFSHFTCGGPSITCAISAGRSHCL
jgi:hypothetical protein